MTGEKIEMIALLQIKKRRHWTIINFKEFWVYRNYNGETGIKEEKRMKSYVRHQSLFQDKREKF